MVSDDIKKLEENNKELREIVNNSWDAIGIIDKQSKFIYVNTAFSPILGYTKEELLKITFESLILDEYKDSFNTLLEKNIENRYSSEVQVVCQRKDTKKVYLQITISLMLNKQFFVMNAKDITKQISDDEILDRYVISSHTNIDDTITKVSSAFSLLSGYSKEDLIDKKQFEIIFENNKKNLLEEITIAAKQNIEWAGQLSCLKKDNSIFWVDVKVKPIYNKYGDITGLTYLMFDITNELILTSQKQNLITQVSRAEDKILVQQSKLAVMAETLQMVSHEWRQPLNIISLQAQRLELQYDMNAVLKADEVLVVLDSIKNTASQLSATIEDFQNYINIKSIKKEVEISHIINKVIESFQSNEDTQNIKLIKDIMLTTPLFETYENELITTILNLLINAKEAILRNDIKSGVIKLKEYYKDNYIYFEISDNGKGIKEDIMDKIFEPYFSKKESRQGVGLGLYACKMIIETHLNGSIKALNHNEGALFILKLPINYVKV